MTGLKHQRQGLWQGNHLSRKEDTLMTRPSRQVRLEKKQTSSKEEAEILSDNLQNQKQVSTESGNRAPQFLDKRL